MGIGSHRKDYAKSYQLISMEDAGTDAVLTKWMHMSKKIGLPTYHPNGRPRTSCSR